jgi:hypothetical protein
MEAEATPRRCKRFSRWLPAMRRSPKRAGGQKEWARKSGVVPSMISMVLTGDRPPNEKLLSALKLRRVVIFERVR